MTEPQTISEMFSDIILAEIENYAFFMQGVSKEQFWRDAVTPQSDDPAAFRSFVDAVRRMVEMEG